MRTRASRHSTRDRNWGNATPGGGCRYELAIARVCAEVMRPSSQTRQGTHQREVGIHARLGGKASSQISGTELAPGSHEAGCLEEFQQNLPDRTLLALRSNHAELMFTRPCSQDGEPAIYCHFKFLTGLNDQYWRWFKRTTLAVTQVKRPA